MPALLHVDPRRSELDLADERAEIVVKEIHHYAMVVVKNDASQAFALLAAALGDFAERTDAPVDLLNVAIELLLEQRAEVIQAAKAAAAEAPGVTS